jgi:hypothetical protein
MTLPTIHPLAAEPLGRGPNGECLCNHCRHWHPLIEHLEAQLNEEGRKLLRELTDHWMDDEEDLDVAEAKLNGTWPGWEWLPAAIAKHEAEQGGEADQ